MRAHLGLLIVVATVALTGNAVAGADGAPSGIEGDAAAEYLERAASRAAEVDYSGRIVLEWTDEGRARRAVLSVRSAGGLLEMAAGRHVMSTETVRAYAHDGRWYALSVGTGGSVPIPSEKYALALTPDARRVAGRQTTLVTVRERTGGALVQRVYIDDSTGRVLRREWFDGAGRVARVLAYVALWDDPDRVEMPPPDPDAPTAVDTAPETTDDLPDPYRDPDQVGAGFVLVGRSRHGDGLAQVHYSDGVFEMSVFEQPGRLDRGSLPPGGREVSVGAGDAVLYVLPVGHVLVWEHDDVVYTAVSEAPATDLADAARDLAGDSSPGVLARLTGWVLGPFSW